MALPIGTKVRVFLDRGGLNEYYPLFFADVAELVDAQRSGRCGSNLVEVRVLSSALLMDNWRPETVAFSVYRHQSLGL